MIFRKRLTPVSYTHLDVYKRQVLKSGEIAAVISNNPGAFALKRAENAGIKTYVVKSGVPDFEDRLSQIIEENGIDLIILAG